MTCTDAGFTLIEAIATLAILALALTLGLPAFSQTAQNYRVATALHLASTDLALARSTAIMRSTPIVVCPRIGYRCRSDRNWSHGWMVFTDVDGNRQPDTPADIIRITDPPRHTALRIDSTRTFVRYQRDGRAAHSNQTIRACAGKQLAGTVVINNLGRVRSARQTASVSCPQG